MSTIQVKFDNSLQQTDIIIPLTYSSAEEAQEYYTNNQPEIQQTMIYGIQAPLIMINNIVVNFTDVISFELICDSVYPKINLIVQDRYNLTSTIDTPGIDNELRVQILPKFENKYKKINLSFYITQMKNNNGIIHLSGDYKLSKFISSNIKAFGQLSIYELCEQIAKNSGLGFATNVADDLNTRYIYCDNKSYKELLKNETTLSCNDTQIYDYWIDWWNNLILVDIYERYNATDKDEDMLIWISGQNQEIREGSDIDPMQTVATLHNHPAQKNTELYIQNLKNITSPGNQMNKGTDRVYSIYNCNNTEYLDYLIQDGDTKKDVFCKYEYLGEVYGEHNYLLGLKKYETFKQKIATNETIEISLKTPLLGIMRGNKVNVMWYINDSMSANVKKTLQDFDVISSNPETNIQIDDNEENENINGNFEIDQSISGQYFVNKCSMKFKDNAWDYTITLCRPSINKPKLINEE